MATYKQLKVDDTARAAGPWPSDRIRSTAITSARARLCRSFIPAIPHSGRRMVVWCAKGTCRPRPYRNWIYAAMRSQKLSSQVGTYTRGRVRMEAFNEMRLISPPHKLILERSANKPYHIGQDDGGPTWLPHEH